MSEYRDDLGAAHRRIALLEEALGQRAPRLTSRRRPALLGWVIAVLALAFYLCVGAALTGAWTFGRRSSEAVPVPAAVTETPVPPRLNASWYTQASVLPTMVDVDGDGTKDLVGLFWRAGQDEQPLYAAAIDGNTFQMKWSAGPYRSQWASTRTHFAVAGGKVVVTDSRDNVITLDLATGHQLATTKLAGGAVEMCAFDDGTPRVLLRTPLLPAEQRDRSLNVETGTFDTITGGGSCPLRYDNCYATKKGLPCYTWGAIAKAPREATTTPSFYVTRTMQEGSLAIAFGNPTPGGGRPGRDDARAVAFDRTTGKVLWKQPLLADGDELHYGAAQAELHGDALVAFYQTKDGPFRLVARDARTGDARWAATIPRSEEGSYAAAFGVEGDRVLVVMNHTLHVYDAATGSYLAGLDASTL